MGDYNVNTLNELKTILHTYTSSHIYFLLITITN